MKLSLNWLNKYFKKTPNWDDVLHRLTMAGIEVEEIVEVKESSGSINPIDKVVEFKITPNRGDCLSVLGILREIAVLTNSEINFPPLKFSLKDRSLQNLPETLTLQLERPDLCPNYLAMTIKGINNKVTLPREMIDYLERSGLRSISPIVDITNYVMLELGQPLHAFNMDKVGKSLWIRLANSNEYIKLLDGTNANLTADTLVICDEDNQVAAIAGVMGGAESGVDEETNDIILESAFFIPNVIMGKAKHYGINSDSAYRFERGIDPQLQDLAIRYAANLITLYCGGEITGINAHTGLIQTPTITFSYDDVIALIGMQIKLPQIDEILQKLGFKVLDKNDYTVTIEVPSHRFDIKIKEDIVEEIVRIYGYDNIEPIMPLSRMNLPDLDDNYSIQQNLKNRLVNLGYTEIIGYAFLEHNIEAQLGDPEQTAIKLKNPIANLDVLRTSLIADLVKVLESNLNRGHKWGKFFEVARVFYGEDEALQPLKLAGLIYGNKLIPGWANLPKQSVDFYDLKHDVEILLTPCINVEFKSYDNYSVFHKGRCAKIYADNQEVGVIGQLHPKYLSTLNLSDLPYAFELKVDALINQIARNKVIAREISKFQKVERDLSFVIGKSVNVGEILSVIQKANIPYLINLNVFDVYEDGSLGDGLKSVAINFMFQGNKTLSEEEVNLSIEGITSLVISKFVAKLR